MPKLFKFGAEARQKLLTGITVLADCVTATLGPKGRNVTIGNLWTAPSVLHDGVSVAKMVDLKDPFEDIGAQMVKEASIKTNSKVGDGTTTATLLTAEMCKNGIELLDSDTTPKVNPMTLKKGIDYAVKKVTEELTGITHALDDSNKIAQVGTISSADPVIGKLIADAMHRVGKDGAITVEEGSGMTTTVDYKEGMEFDRGYISSNYVTDPLKMESVIEDTMVLVTDQKITNGEELMVLLKRIVEETGRKELAIICDSLDGQALQTLNLNVEQDRFNATAIFAPGIGERRIAMLEDIAALTGATLIRRENGKTLDKVTIEELGRADKVWCDANSTKIIGGKGKEEIIKARVATIKNELEKATTAFDKSKIQERLSKMTGGAAIIKVGAPTEAEMKEKKERVIDAVEATKAAVDGGIVPGGGIALYRARQILKGLSGVRILSSDKDDYEESPDFLLGMSLVYDALERPLKKLLENSGDNVADVIKQIAAGGQTDYGYDVEKQKYGDMFLMGVIDPFKVTKSALEIAASITGTVLSTEVLIVDEPNPEIQKIPVV